MRVKLFSRRLCIILLTVFSVMRIYRNSFNHNTSKIGGLWNIISIYFIFLFFILMAFKGNYIVKNKPITFAILYSLMAVINSLVNINSFSVSIFYNILMINFFVSILVCFYFVGLCIKPKEYKMLELSCILIIFIAFLGIFKSSKGYIGFVMVSIAYYSLCILPLFLIVARNKFIYVTGYLMVLFTVMLSGKRTGFLAIALFFITVSFCRAYTSKSLNSLIKIMSILVLTLIIFFIVYDKLQSTFDITILERLLALKNDGGSGRKSMYLQIWRSIGNSSFLEIIFGHGCNTTGEVLKIHSTAHNDFLEIFYDYGIAPFLLFILFYIALFREWVKMLHKNYPYSDIFIGTIIISLLMSMFSTYCVSFGYVICGMASLGFMLGNFKAYKLKMII